MLAFGAIHVQAQSDFYKDYRFTEADTLRGQLSIIRSNYDVTFYDLDIQIDIAKRHIAGKVQIDFVAQEYLKLLQIDLFENMNITKITCHAMEVAFERKHNAVFVDMPIHEKGAKGSLIVHYEGNPTTAIRAPWDGGFVWKKDSNGKNWVGVACEGTGASLWWPNKDHLSDEPDSMAIRIAVPEGVQCVANGNLRGEERLANGFTKYNWFVSYPINNYNVTVNIADYFHFSEEYTAQDGATMPMDYYVLQENKEVAQQHFKQTKGVLACFEHYFGKYPFWNDGFALVETPYLGMEHQGAIAYGNQYNRGYMGGMIPEDMNWDYIIVHETGHEYFGNSISVADHAEMWIHESFTTYMEALYVECTMSKNDATRYLLSQRPFIVNKEPIVGPKDVNFGEWQSSDHYYKGAWVLHTIRSVVDNDELWFQFLKELHEKNRISMMNTEQIVAMMNETFDRDVTAIMNQYLNYPQVPTLLFRKKQIGKDLEVKFKWEAGAPGFDMPFKIGGNGVYQTIEPSTEEVRSIILKNVDETEFEVARELFLVDVKRI